MAQLEADNGRDSEGKELEMEKELMEQKRRQELILK